MVATSPTTALKQSRVRHIPFVIPSMATGVTRYLLGTATASTAPVLGIKGRISRLHVTTNGGGTGDLTVNVYVLPGANTPAADYLAMTVAITTLSDLVGTTTTVSTALAGAEIASTDRLAVRVVAGTNSATQTDGTILITIETDD